MKIGIAQIDTRVGDVAGNARRVTAAVEAAVELGATLVVLPGSCLTGCHPRDLLLDDGFVAEVLEAGRALARRWTAGPAVLLGTLDRAPAGPPGHPRLRDGAAWLQHGDVQAFVGARLLACRDVDDGPRWFVPATASQPLPIAGQAVGVLPGDDLDDIGHPVHPAAELVAAGASLLVCVTAAHYRPGIAEARRERARRAGVPVLYVNAVGGQDELVYDGGSFALGRAGRLVEALPRFEEDVRVVNLEAGVTVEAPVLVHEEEVFRALVLGLRDFAAKNGLRHAVLGLSGGIDSALVACLAREALGPAGVTAVALPSRFNDPRSTTCARQLAESLGIACEVVPIEGLHAAAEGALAHLGTGPGDTLGENLQARLRAMVLMAYVNRRGGLLLNTSNKTELTVGYGTLYGDLAGAVAVIGDLTKPEVYAVARWYDAGRGVIPPFVFERPPSAELKPGQVDPFDYPRVAPLVEALVQGCPLPADADPAEVARFRRMIRQSEHKRWQAGVVLKVTERAFGSGRQMPITRA